MAKTGTISIACASAFWGDTPFAVDQLLTDPELDYIAFDYLSEVTMALLARAQKKNPELGYTADFLTDVIEPHLQTYVQRKIKLISNAGGINSPALMEKITAAATRMGVQVKIVCVSGDDLRGSPHLSDEQKKFSTVNAYLGAAAVKQALDAGADIVLTGRTVDTALITGPLMHGFAKAWDDYEFLAQASLAGHILECGTQATGGNFTDWRLVPDAHNVGFPIARVESNGRFRVRKAKGTGGLVTSATVAEQLIYEIGDPRNYILPDVICDFSGVQLESISSDEVEVTGARGRTPTSTYKVSATKQTGWRVSTTAYIGGGEATEKARHVGEVILKRVHTLLQARNLKPFCETLVEALGAGEQALLRLSAAHEDPVALELLAKEIAPAATSLAPGIANLLGGRAQAVPRMAFSSFLIEKSKVDVTLIDGKIRTPVAVTTLDGVVNSAALEVTQSPGTSTPPTSGERIKLGQIAFARSGDKGNHVNVGVIAREPKYHQVLKQCLTPAMVADFFKSDFDAGSIGQVECWELPGIHAVNFLLHDCLGGGGSFSLRIDPQGKAFAQRLLQMTILVPKGTL